MYSAATLIIKKSEGFTLLEVVIALMIMVSLFVALIGSILSLDKLVMKCRAMSQHMQASNKVIQTLRREIGKAGQLPCGNVADGFPVQSYRAYILNNDSKIMVTPNSIRISYQSYPGNTVIAVSDGGMQILVGEGDRCQENDLVIISDCVSGQINRISSVEMSGKRQVLTLDRAYERPLNNVTRIGEFVVDEYFFVQGLYMRDVLQNVNVVVKGVSAFQVAELNRGVINLSFDTSFMSQTLHWDYMLPVTRGG